MRPPMTEATIETQKFVTARAYLRDLTSERRPTQQLGSGNLLESVANLVPVVSRETPLGSGHSRTRSCH